MSRAPAGKYHITLRNPSQAVLNSALCSAQPSSLSSARVDSGSTAMPWALLRDPALRSPAGPLDSSSVDSGLGSGLLDSSSM
ncbi:hypothetical protein J3E68DRAFT_405645 [Trichoderma sp. SZMC 28012]